MTYQMRPKTPAGARLADAAQNLVPLLRERAAQADRDGQVCAENFQDLMDAGITAAFVPSDLGGFGVQSVHDWLVGIATLARGDGSTAIAVNMHLGVSRGMAQAYYASVARGRVSDAVRAPLSAIAAGKMLICATATEAGTDNLHPLTEARAIDAGWRIDGRKMFVTMSPVATHLGMNLRMRDDDGDHLVTTMLPINAPGLQPQNDWDALGMRASGSQSVVFDNVRIVKGALRKLGPWGQWSTSVLVNRTLGNLPLVAAFLGIAEHAYELTLDALGTNQRVGEPVRELAGVHHSVGEIEIELAKCRSILQHAGSQVDDFLAQMETAPPSLSAAHELMKDYQCAKWVVNQGAIDIVNKAMDLLGGRAFTSAHPLARLYRDVRAGPFMQPYSPPEARAYVGKVALGFTPET